MDGYNAANYLRSGSKHPPTKRDFVSDYGLQTVQYVKSHLRFNTNTIPMKQFNIRKKPLLNKIMR